MAESPNLDITHVATSQNNKEVTINDAVDALDKALCDYASIDMGSTATAVDLATIQQAIVLIVSNPAGAALTLTATKRLFVVYNTDASNSVAVTVGSTVVTVTSETLAMLYMDGTTDGLYEVASGGGGGGVTTFLALTDTPSAFTGQAGKYLAVNTGETAIEFVAGGGGGVTTFLALTDTPSSFTADYYVKVNAAGTALEFVSGGTTGIAYTAPFKGAKLPGSTLSAQDFSSWTSVTGWGAADFDTDSFYNGTNPERLSIPSGITKVKVRAAVYVSDATADYGVAARLMHYDYSAASASAVSYMNKNNADTYDMVMLESPVVEVEENDYFYVDLIVLGDTSITVNDSTSAYFEIEALELTTSTGRPYDLASWTAGQPGTSAKIFQHVAARAFTVPATASQLSQGYAATAATAVTTFTLAKNGSSFGTMEFAASGQTATFTVATATSFAIGDVLTITAPASQDSTLADVSATLVVNLT